MCEGWCLTDEVGGGGQWEKMTVMLTVHDVRPGVHDVRAGVHDVRAGVHDARAGVHDMRAGVHL